MAGKTVFRDGDTLFNNSKCLFIEYHDVLSMPWFTMLAFIKNTKSFNNIFKIYEISDYDLTGLLEWYIYRKHRNVFKSIGILDDMGTLSDDGYNVLLTKAMNISGDFYNIPTNLKFLSTLRLLVTDHTMINQVVIYSETNEPMIEESLKKYFAKDGTKVKYISGDFKDIIKSIPRDSTYVFSDIEKVNTLVELNRLNLSSVLVVNGLRYNYMEDDHTKIKVDLNELSKTHLFKYSFFDNFDFTDAITNGVIPSEIESIPESSE